MDTAPWDMAVIGAGPAGSVCAYSGLATLERMRVALIDREVFPRDKSCGDAIRSDAASALGDLGIGGIFDGRQAIRRFQTTCPPKYGYLEKIANWNKHAYYIVERKMFDHYLFERAIEKGARDYTGHKLTDAKFQNATGLWDLILNERGGAEIKIRCRVLVGADGAGSRVRRLAGLRLNEDGHTSLALRAYALAEGLAEETMRIDWLDSLIPGYGWTFPLTQSKVNIGVGIDKRDFKRNGSGLEAYLREYVQYLRNQGVTIGNLGKIKTHPLPLASQTLPLVPQRQVALIGDAAAMIDPFTGEGIHYGIWAGRALGHIVGQSVKGGDVQTGLESYAKAYSEQYGKTMESSQSLRVMLRFHKFFA